MNAAARRATAGGTIRPWGARARCAGSGRAAPGARPTARCPGRPRSVRGSAPAGTCSRASAGPVSPARASMNWPTTRPSAVGCSATAGAGPRPPVARAWPEAEAGRRRGRLRRSSRSGQPCRGYGLGPLAREPGRAPPAASRLRASVEQRRPLLTVGRPGSPRTRSRAAVQVHLGVQDVAARPAVDRHAVEGGQHAPQPGEVAVQRRPGPWRRVGTPDSVDEQVHRHHTPGVDRERRQQLRCRGMPRGSGRPSASAPTSPSRRTTTGTTPDPSAYPFELAHAETLQEIHTNGPPL